MQISRRDALMGATAAAVVTGATVVPLALKSAGVQAALTGEPNDEPLLALRRQWLAWREHIHHYPDESDEARDPLYDRLTEIERQIYVTPAQTPRGVLIKLELWQYFYAPWNHPWTPWWEGDVDAMAMDETGVAMVMRDLERLAGGPRPT